MMTSLHNNDRNVFLGFIIRLQRTHTKVWALLIDRALFEFSGGQGCIRSKRNGSPGAGVGSNFANWNTCNHSSLGCIRHRVFYVGNLSYVGRAFLGGR